MVAFVSWSGVPSVSISGVAGGAGEGFAFCSEGGVKSLRVVHGHMANLFAQIAGNSRAFFARVSKLVALTAYRLLVVVYYSAPLIANLERVGDGWLV